MVNATAVLTGVGDFFSFIADRLAHFNTLSRGEQASYVVVGVGIILMLVSLVLFLL